MYMYYHQGIDIYEDEGSSRSDWQAGWLAKLSAGNLDLASMAFPSSATPSCTKGPVILSYLNFLPTSTLPHLLSP